MIDIYFTLIPSFLLILLGYGTTKIGYFQSQWTSGLTSFVQKVAVPALLFNVFSEFTFSSLLHPLSLIAFYLGMAINFVLIIIVFSRFFRRSKLQASLLTFGGSFSNTILLGIPLAMSLFGTEGSLPIYMIIAFHTPVLSLFLAMLVGIYKEPEAGRNRLRTIAYDLVTNPIIIAVSLAVLCNVADISINSYVRSFLDALASVASTTALFAIGAGLVRFSLHKSFTDTLVLSFFKLIISPAIVAFLSLVVFSVPIELAKINIYMAALPTGITAYLMADYYRGEQDVASGTILATTFASALTIGAIMHVFDIWYQ